MLPKLIFLQPTFEMKLVLTSSTIEIWMFHPKNFPLLLPENEKKPFVTFFLFFYLNFLDLGRDLYKEVSKYRWPLLNSERTDDKWLWSHAGLFITFFPFLTAFVAQVSYESISQQDDMNAQ